MQSVGDWQKSRNSGSPAGLAPVAAPGALQSVAAWKAAHPTPTPSPYGVLATKSTAPVDFNAIQTIPNPFPSDPLAMRTPQAGPTFQTPATNIVGNVGETNPIPLSLADQAAGKVVQPTLPQKINSDLKDILNAPSPTRVPITPESYLNIIYGPDGTIGEGGIVGDTYKAWQKAVAGFQTANSQRGNEQALTLAHAGLDAISAFFTPVSSFFSKAATIPGPVGDAANILNKGFATLGVLGGDPLSAAVQAAPLSDKTKADLAPLAQEIGALASQIVVGGAAVESLGALKEKTGAFIEKLSEDARIKDLNANPVMQEHIANTIGLKPEAPVAQPMSVADWQKAGKPVSSYAGPTEQKVSTDIAVPSKETTPIPGNEVTGKFKSAEDPLVADIQSGKYKSAEDFVAANGVPTNYSATPGETRITTKSTQEPGVYYHGSSPESALSIADGGIKPKVSKLDKVGEKAVSLTADKGVAGSYGNVIFKVEDVPVREAPKGAVQGDNFNGFELRTDNVPKNKITEAIIPLGKSETGDTRIILKYKGKTPEYGTINELADQLRAKGIKTTIVPHESKLTDLYNQHKPSDQSPPVSPPPPSKPVSSGGNKKNPFASRVFERLQSEHPELKGQLNYDPIKLKEDASKAVDLIQSNKQDAFRKAMGVEPTTDVTSTALNIAMSEKAIEEGNWKLAARMIRNRSLAQTRRGQEISAERGSVTGESTADYVKQLIASRMDSLGKTRFDYVKKLVGKGKSTKGKAQDVIDGEVKKIEDKIKAKKLDTKTALSLLDQLACIV